MSRNKLFLGPLLAIISCGALAAASDQPVMDPYDPRNNIPLLQAATRTSGVNVPVSSIQGTVAPVTNASPNIQKLRDLKTLKDEGILTQKEYDSKKAEILKGR